ncbi:MAG: exodeoxyribonuclease VII small subunit [Gammaproteobacteria bacterium]|nr:exodeoxyribonuclease VII small subunit [Gammaproteobacteria bacterium]NND39666.1 exodeoxyribonuclease VII small subunit [Pseudomonadales bacterium]MBT8151672.1 exodeoxyribonuclease VII small subunit [Gammaproteobacteria bacterium]NNL11407.1 exodeoxyribonuclease VII small subunit [Pseudomonadales bacterium]NNM12628.1 exodeoxyribonuclease VII small subunit [Pseudomonadales bacterium]
MPRSKKKPDFESSIERLEEIVELLEEGELSLEESLKHFEEGVALTRNCQGALGEAEQKIRLLSEKNGELSIAELDSTDPDGASLDD